MPIVTLSPSAVSLAYTDTGVPSPSRGDYDTLILVHGLGFNKEIFSPLYACASQHNARLIAYNQRGYRDSEPHDGSLGHEQTAATLVQDLVELIHYVTATMNVPRKPIVLGWSKGTLLLIGIATDGYLPAVVRAEVLSEIRGMILYEPPGSAFGMPLTGAASVLAKPGTDAGQFANDFALWISGFYEPGSEVAYKTSMETLPEKLIAVSSEPQMAMAALPWKLSVDKDRLRRLVIDAVRCEDAPVGVCWNGHTVKYIADAAQEAARVGGRVQRLDSHGNHFAFAHEPDAWLGAVLGFFAVLEQEQAQAGGGERSQGSRAAI
ncbi:Alpha/Beta hydrolase protein [Limtongia smithiae]|uniref:Alpha/Beta hydrolase protein n=1 Tax=Limtongia smithiae TaxID=1125753 RepID=UPI0034CD03F5